MAKPIFIIRFPQETYSHLQKNETIEDTIEQISSKLPDYHVMCIFDCISSIGDVKFEMFNSKDCNEIEFKELQRKVLETIKTK